MDAITRRRFLLASGVAGAGALATGATGISWSQVQHAAATRPAALGDGVLVVVTLYGGNDGLNMVVPIDDPAYHDARPEVALKPAATAPLGDGLALNGVMKHLKAQWDARRLAVVRGVSYPTPSRSHFQSMDIWQTASPKTPETSGWLGRWLDATGTDPMRALAIDTTLPPLLAGAVSAGSTVPAGSLRLPTGAYANGLWAMDVRATTGVASTPTEAVRESGLDLRTVAGTVDKALGNGGGAGPGKSGKAGKGGKGGDLAGQLGLVARLVAAGVPTKVYAVSLGGFDTHSGEQSTSTRLLGELDAALGSFTDALAGTPRGADVVTVVYSEFGRRVAANASQGTDHGTANPVLVLGQRVRGGFVGAQPSLTDLDEGDLKPDTDFRAVYATLLGGVLGGDVARVLGGDVDGMARLPLLT